MSLPGLVLELVLAGGLFLAAFLLPYLRCGALELEPTPAVLTIGVALAFLVGVLIDRFADSLLGTWDDLHRCSYMGRKKAKEARFRLIGDVKEADPFPEDWLRHYLLARGDAFEAWARDLRVRIRVARSVTVLAPLLGASVAVGERAAFEGRAGSDGYALQRAVDVCAAGSAGTLGLIVVCALAALACRGPRTTDALRPKEPRWWRWLAGTWAGGGSGAPGGWQAVVPTPPALWLGGCGASFVAAAEGLHELDALAIGLVTATATLLAWLAWSRISRTYRQFLWDTAWHGAPAELAAALRPKVPVVGRSVPPGR